MGRIDLSTLSSGSSSLPYIRALSSQIDLNISGAGIEMAWESGEINTIPGATRSGNRFIPGAGTYKVEVCVYITSSVSQVSVQARATIDGVEQEATTISTPIMNTNGLNEGSIVFQDIITLADSEELGIQCFRQASSGAVLSILDRGTFTIIKIG